MTMAETFDYDVFLSYSSKDRDVVHALAKRLLDSGCGSGWTTG